MKGQNTYPNLVKKLGKAKAKEYMRELRKKRLNHDTPSSFQNLPKEQLAEISKKGSDARWGKKAP